MRLVERKGELSQVARTSVNKDPEAGVYSGTGTQLGAGMCVVCGGEIIIIILVVIGNFIEYLLDARHPSVLLHALP